MSNLYTIEELSSIINPIAKEFGVKKVALFGSYSTGTQTTESDIDLLIDKGNIKGLFMFNKFINTLSDALGKNIDVITYSSLHDSLIKNSVNGEIILYEQQE